MSVQNLLYENPYTIFDEQNISNSLQIGYVSPYLTIINSGLDSNTQITTAQLTTMGGSGITGNLTPNTYPIASGLHTLIDGKITDDGSTFKISQGSENVLVSSGINNNLLISPSGTVDTLNNTLDDGTGNMIIQGNMTIGNLAGSGQVLNIPTNTYNTYNPNIVSSNSGIGGYSTLTTSADNLSYNLDPSGLVNINNSSSIDALGNAIFSSVSTPLMSASVFQGYLGQLDIHGNTQSTTHGNMGSGSNYFNAFIGTNGIFDNISSLSGGVITVQNPLIVQPIIDSSTAFQVNNSVGGNFFNINNITGAITTNNTILNDGSGNMSVVGQLNLESTLLYNTNNASAGAGYVAMEPLNTYEFQYNAPSGLPANSGINIPYPTGKAYTDVRRMRGNIVITSGSFQGTYSDNSQALGGQVLFYFQGTNTTLFIVTSSSWAVTADNVTFYLFFETI